MTTTVYQKFISRYAETFTMVEMTEGTDFYTAEIIPSAKVDKMSEEEVTNLIEELSNWQNEKASWSDGEEGSDDEDMRDAYHQKWDEINSDLDKVGV